MTINEQTLQELAKQFGLALNWGDKNIISYLQDLVKRVITYEFCQSIFWLVIGALFVVIGIIFFIGVYINKFVNEIIIIAIIAVIIGVIIGVIIIGYQIDDIILCGTLPEKILLRYIQSN